MRMFAMRLMHAGMIVFVAGETTTPAIASGDCIIACSGSGETPVTCLLAEAAIKCGATLVALTTAPESRLARIASLVLMIPAPSKQSCMPGADVSAARGSVQFAGSLFEQQALLVCDALCLALAEAAHLDRATMWSRHANIE
jgi:6-phospho-3-hexuloisomerase